MSKMFAATLVAVALAAALQAGSNDDEDSKIFPYPYQSKVLDNGLKVIVVRTDYPNIVSLQIPVRTGSRNEVEPGKSGFAHFFEHMMFRGTERYPSEKYTAILKNAGADQNAYTTDDFTNYHITFSKDDLETVLMLEADRFQNLRYSTEDFKTEARAVLGEYNKNAANPVRKLFEVLREAAFREHTYRHTTMGFLEDIENMPNQYDYSLKFFDRYYRPEYATVVVAGDVEPDQVFPLVEKYWGGWKRGGYSAEIPTEPPPQGPIYRHVDWETPTLPWVVVAFRGPAFSDVEKDMVAMDLVQSYAFSSSSDLYQRLVVTEQKVDQLFPFFPDRRDPQLLMVGARVKDPADVWTVRDEILKTFAKMRSEPVSAQRLKDLKGHLKYQFAASLDNSEAIADALVPYIALTGDPESLNKVYRLYDALTPEDMRRMAARYFIDAGELVVTLSHQPLPKPAETLPSVDALAAADAALPEVESILQPGQSPLVNFRFLFHSGSAADPEGKEGLAALTAAMVTDAGSRDMRYADIQKAFFPMAAYFANQVDKEMTVLEGGVHKDNLAAYAPIILGQLLTPAWDEDDFRRVKTNLVNQIKVDLRDNNDEELGKEVLYEMIYRGHPYGHLNLGHLDSVESLTLDDVREFHARHYTRANLTLGMAGGYSEEDLANVRRALAGLPEGTREAVVLPAVEIPSGFDVEIVQKETPATAISFGFPIDVTRSHPDFAALWLVRSYLGEHRSTNSHLYQRIREVRGMNYGDYAYIEYFPRGMFLTHPDPNLGRRQQIFQVWIRPVVPKNAHFAIRTAMYEIDRLLREGMTREDFEATRNYLLKFSNILTASQDRRLGYALDSRYYGIDEFNRFISENLKKLTLEDVNRVLRQHLQNKNIQFAIVTKDAEDLRRRLVEDAPSPIQYDADKPAELLAEDKVIEVLPLRFSADRVKIRPLEEVFR